MILGFDYLDILGCAFPHCYSGVLYKYFCLAGADRPDGVCDQFDMCRCSAAAAANEPRTCLHKSLSKRRHVLWRTHVKLPTLNISRQSCIWLSGKLLRSNCTHLL